MSVLQILRLETNKKSKGFDVSRAGFLEKEALFRDNVISYAKGSLFSLESIVAMLDNFCKYNYDYTAYVVNNLGLPLDYRDSEVKMTYMNTLIIEALLEHNVQIMDVTTGKSVVDSVIDFVIKGKSDEDYDVYQDITDLLIERGWVDETVTAQERAKIRDDEAKNAVLGGTVEEFEKLTDEEKGITSDE